MTDNQYDVWIEQSHQLQSLLLQAAVSIGKFSGMLGSADNFPPFWSTLGLLQTMQWHKEELDTTEYEEVLWLSGAEDGVLESQPKIAQVIQWFEAYAMAWASLQRRPMLNTALLEKIQSRAYGRSKKVRSGNIGGMSLVEHMRRLDHFLHLDNRLDPIMRSLAAMEEIRRLKPFRQGWDEVATMVPVLNIALEYGVEMPLVDVTGQFAKSGADVEEQLNLLTEGLHNTVEAMHQIRRMALQAYERSFELLPARMQSKDLFRIVFSRPTIKVRDLVEAGIVQRQTAAEYLRAMEDVRMLQSRRVGREVLFRNELLCEYLLELL